MPALIADIALLRELERGRGLRDAAVAVGGLTVTDIFIRRAGDADQQSRLLDAGLHVVALSPMEMTALIRMRRTAPLLPVCGASVLTLAECRGWEPVLAGAVISRMARELGIGTRGIDWLFGSGGAAELSMAHE